LTTLFRVENQWRAMIFGNTHGVIPCSQPPRPPRL
jgi:sulfite exporter TauE/SafE